MAELEKATLRIRWIRSGTGFSRKQKEIVRSLGLRRLHHVVERPDTAQVRGLIAMVPHLVEVVTTEELRIRTRGPEYNVLAPEGPSGAAAVLDPAAGGTAEAPEASVAKRENK
jgi:large subunit ribosomal protein L30